MKLSCLDWLNSNIKNPPVGPANEDTNSLPTLTWCDTNPEPGTPIKVQVTSLHQKTQCHLSPSFAPNFCFKQQQRSHKNRSQISPLCIFFPNNSFYYVFTNILFFPINFTLHLISKDPKLKRPTLLVNTAVIICWSIKKNGNGKDISSAQPVKINCSLSKTPGIKSCLLPFSLHRTSCILQAGF